MIKRYRISLPTREECHANGIKFEGQEARTRLWLMGVAWGIQFTVKACEDMAEQVIKFKFDIVFAANTYFYVDCDNESIMNSVKEHLTQNLCKIEEIAVAIPA